MAIIVHKTTNYQSSKKNSPGVWRFRKQFIFQPKSIVALLVSASVVYFSSFLKVVVELHRLDQSESDLTKESDARNIKSNSNEEDLRAEEIKLFLKAQETKPRSKTKENEPKPRKRPLFRAKPHGYMVSPDVIVEETRSIEQKASVHHTIPEHQILTAYIEDTDRSAWSTKPLPSRIVKAEDLIETKFSELNSCSKLPEQWPVDNYPDADPFLPWIHDVFPTHDGKYIQFVAQNRRRCRTGTTKDEELILNHTSPQVALFQHVSLKRLTSSTKNGPRYRLSSHEDADPESLDTRFICRFKPSGDITFSEFNNDYEWTAFQKRQQVMFHENGRDNYQIQTSQLIFRCPVPNHLIEVIRTGESVLDDWATIFLDLIPVRTPPRYGPPDRYLVPRYAESVNTPEKVRFDPDKEWGKNHVLPALEDSGRWENIPICKPSLMTYEPQALNKQKRSDKKNHHLVSCLWASTGYSTRGNRYAINDGQRRLLEWITYNKILGFDHFYIYDNSGAFTNETSLEPIAALFPEDVTVIKWPSRVCNNNPNNVDSVGERSSQYAAEASCRLRFGPHVNWIGQFDIDEYIIPMGNNTGVLPLLEKLENEGNKIISFASWRAW